MTAMQDNDATTEAELTAEMVGCDDYHLRYQQVKQRVLQLTEPAQRAAAPALNAIQMNHTMMDNNQRYRLPKNEIFKFSDRVGKLYTGRLCNLECGATAMEKHLGWTLIGKNNEKASSRSDPALLTLSMFAREASVEQLWRFDTIGITDPIEQKSKENQQQEVLTLPNNRATAERRLATTQRKLEDDGLLSDYGKVFQEWLSEGIIEEMPQGELRNRAHYLPHRHVVKEGSTTRIEPVFDASARDKSSPSLNQCLDPGPNLIESRRAEVLVETPWFQRYHRYQRYQHCRVVFGVTSSHFLLRATIDLHREEAIKRAGSEEERSVLNQLKNSFYVDNCVTSVSSKESAERFQNIATSTMADGGFDLRGWKFSDDVSEQKSSPVLGLSWDKDLDVLQLADSLLIHELPTKITKRTILSITQKVFDPLGMASPTVLLPKLMLQRLWQTDLDWDTNVPETIKRDFIPWCQGLPLLKELKIQRWAFGKADEKLSLHLFVDASQEAYAAMVPGELNPAGLPSRGCSARQLVDCQWLLGPECLKLPADQWPSSCPDTDETLIHCELRKTPMKLRKSSEQAVVLNQVLSNVTQDQEGQVPWYLKEFSEYYRIVRLVGWMQRFLHNAGRGKDSRTRGELTGREIQLAELTLMWVVQQESFSGMKDPRLSSMIVVEDKRGLLRLKSPCRKAVRAVVQRCVTHRRYNAQKLQPPPIGLPENRVRDARVFEITEMDFAGPLFLRCGSKAWICLFTCAVYRAVHLELVSSLSTDIFLEAFRRFIARRGRPSVIYADNATNFRGARNHLKKIYWDKVVKDSSVDVIEWRFNPPAAPWWGGWWERLIRLMKDLLKRTLKKSLLTFEELITVLCDVEAIINSRLLTYLAEHPHQLIPLSPSLFLQEVKAIGVPDVDAVSATSMNKRQRYLQQVREHLRQHFRIEYLGQLQRRSSNNNFSKEVKVGDIVFCRNEQQKRLDCPLAKVIQLYPGRDGKVRVVKLKIETGELTRPLQRLYPLEISTAESPELLKRSKDLGEISSEPPLMSEEVVADRDATLEAEPPSAPEPNGQSKYGVSSQGTERSQVTTSHRGRLIKLPSRYH
ncbi:uncharacterized protein LOC107043403 [Diachasma alloeum]|uniref:uncharacterized protein LOC107043403 n=1 Tax=Diachasma alloeum TaxID=454923 RepID=UPI000738106E|nr:uncharacterized protein LOC107043403 [Diachasma alloeum]